MTTIRQLDVDAVTMITERIRGLTILMETQLYAMIDMEAIEVIPLNAAINCLRDQVEKINALLRAGIDPERKGAQL